LLPFGLAGVLAALLAAVGFVASGVAAPQQTFRAGLVSDVGRFNDKGFNQAQLAGLQRARRVLKVQIRAVESRSAQDYVPNLASMARQGFNIIIGAGFLMANELKQVADQFPNVRFALTDYDVKGAPFNGTTRNVEGLTYATQQNSYLVGCLAARVASREGGRNIGVVGGVKIPPVDTFLAGYRAGAQKCVPGTTVQIGYSQDFIDQAKCKSVATNQIEAGARVIFNVAGPCGLGALDAAKEKGMQGIGVDADQAYLGDHIMTSALKKVDEAAFTAAQEVQDGSFKPGADQVFDVQSGGVGYGEVNAEGEKYKSQVDDQLAKIESGEITDIPTTPTK
jgi:basic membrane protein A